MVSNAQSAFRPSALALGLVLSTLACDIALAYSSTPITSPDPANAIEGDQFNTEERIIIPEAPEREERQGYKNLPILRNLESLPPLVAATRDQLLSAAKSGDADMFRPIIKRQSNVPVVSFEEVPDPVEFLRESSNDGEGRELMAIMIELMEAPYSIIPTEDGQPEIYVWPAYATNDLSALSPSELIDVYKIVSHQDLEEMQLYGGWYFYRVGIDATGEWRYFVASD